MLSILSWFFLDQHLVLNIVALYCLALIELLQLAFDVDTSSALFYRLCHALLHLCLAHVQSDPAWSLDRVLSFLFLASRCPLWSRTVSSRLYFRFPLPPMVGIGSFILYSWSKVFVLLALVGF